MVAGRLVHCSQIVHKQIQSFSISLVCMSKATANKLLTYVVHFRGIAKPSRPGFTFKFGITSLHDRHWMDIVVAFAFIPDAAITIPAILTKRDTNSDCEIERKAFH